MGNVLPVHKKNHKQILKEYRPVFLLPICYNIFESLIFNSLSEYFIESDVNATNQYDFKPGNP